MDLQEVRDHSADVAVESNRLDCCRGQGSAGLPRGETLMTSEVPSAISRLRLVTWLMKLLAGSLGLCFHTASDSWYFPKCLLIINQLI